MDPLASQSLCFLLPGGSSSQAVPSPAGLRVHCREGSALRDRRQQGNSSDTLGMEPRLPSVVTDHGISEERVLSWDSRKLLAELGMELGSHLPPSAHFLPSAQTGMGQQLGGGQEGKKRPS